VRQLGWCLGLCALACGDADRRHVPLPDLGGGAAVIGALFRGEQVVVAAAPANGTIPFSSEIGAEEHAELELGVYDGNLAAVGVEAGPIALATPEGRGQRLATPDRAFGAVIDRGVISSWGPIEPAMLRLSSLRRVLDTACQPIDVTNLVTPAQNGTSWVVPISEGELLLGTVREELLVIDAAENVRSVELDAPPGARPRSAFRDRAGALWIGGIQGELFSATFDGALHLVQVAQLPLREEIRVLDGDPEDASRELFALTASASIARFEGAGVTVLHELPKTGDAASKGGIAWLGPGEAVAGAGSFDQIVRYRSGIISFEPLPMGATGVTALRRLPRFGVLAAQLGGQVYHLDGSRWVTLGRSGIALDLFTFAEIEGGLVAAGSFGYLADYYPDEGFCPRADRPLLGFTIDFLLPLGDRLFASGDRPRGTSQLQVAFLGLRPVR
jgi:hypothetical protein